MLIQTLLQFTTGVLVISVSSSVFCESCENTFGNFQQQPGRFEPKLKLFRQQVFTRMECLDICLRTAECGSYDVKQTYLDNPRKPFWTCVINRRVKDEGLTSLLRDKQKGWTHFSVSSQDLQKVSYFRYCTMHYKRERRKFFAGLLWSSSFICLISVS